MKTSIDHEHLEEGVPRFMDIHHSDPGRSEAQWCGFSGVEHRETDEVDMRGAFSDVGDNTVGSTEAEAGKKAGK